MVNEEVASANQGTYEADPATAVHVPVLLHETLKGLNISKGSTVIDGTVGGGGHTGAILAASAPNGRVLGLDADPEAIDRVSLRFQDAIADKRLALMLANFSNIREVATSLGFTEADAILLDLGVSSFQLHEADRGFSFQVEGPLDMRMDPNQKLSAAVIINEWTEEELANVLYRYGEERKSRRIARRIAAHRPIHGTMELAKLVSAATGGRRGQRIHPATRTFQALRIAVNQELTVLESVLPQCLEILCPGGRLAVISFHSLEDRIVKRWMQQEAADFVPDPMHPMGGKSKASHIRNLTRKPIVPTELERTQNPRSRSAKLRIAEKVAV